MRIVQYLILSILYKLLIRWVLDLVLIFLSMSTGINDPKERNAKQQRFLRMVYHQNARPTTKSLGGSSLNKEKDATLFLELALRGYDLSKLWDEETIAEMIKLA